MAVGVKHKIWLGTLFLFLLLLLMGGVGIYYTLQLKGQAKAVLKDNYESVQYAHLMQGQLDSFDINRQASWQQFDSSLSLQEQNITEQGEQQPTWLVRVAFERLKAGDTSAQLIRTIRMQVGQILTANLEAINRKSKAAETAANNGFTYIMLLAGVVFVVGLTFVVNFPSIITNPIRELTTAIGQIAMRNYSHRIHLNRHDEFGALAKAFNEMASRLEYFESSNLNKLMFEKSRAEAVINSLKDASIGLDNDETILFANAQALQLLGLEAADVVGKQAAELGRRNDLFRFMISDESNTPFKVVVNEKEHYFTKETVEVTQGESKNKVIVIKNITSFKELDVAKTNFIATISHEIKTPLASSDFSLKLLEDARTGTLNEAQHELIESIQQDNQRMLKILSELLNMAQVEAGRIQLHKQNVSASSIVSNAISTVSAAAKEKQIRFNVVLEAFMAALNVDAEKTTWVLNNFLSNAIKYAPADSTVEIAVHRNKGNVVFSVQDHGPGVAKEHQERLFERFYQAPGSKLKGTGLGLAISKDFIEAQGGRIWVESEIGQGASFSFELPLSKEV